MNYAEQQGYVLLTRNCSDFQELHVADSSHFGILAVYQSADESKNMSYKNIVQAISNLEQFEAPLDKQFVVLNQWK